MIPPIASEPPPLFDSLMQVIRDLESGRYTCLQLVEHCLERIRTLDDRVKAWVMVDRDGSSKKALEADVRRKQGIPLSRLDGIPFGVKDIIDVAGWPTVAGFEPWRDNVSDSDAMIVRDLERLGMIPLGKTVTTQFASIDPPPTRNPWNLDRTPGGSSSGSCAAVACRMVPMALGSQTGGSINRPASFCGVVGLKIPFNHWPTDGVFPCADMLDTLGPIVPHVDDLPILLDSIGISWCPELEDFSTPWGVWSEKRTPRVLQLGGRFARLATPEMRTAVDRASVRLIASGCIFETDEFASFFPEELWEFHRWIMMTGCYTTHQDLFGLYPSAYAPKIRGWVETGEEMYRSENYSLIKLRNRQWKLKDEFHKLFDRYDALLLPAAIGEAPTPETTGDPVMNSLWTMFGVPSLTVPISLSSAGLPLGIQLVTAERIRENALDKIITLGRILERIPDPIDQD